MVEDQDKYIYGYKCFNSDMTNRYGTQFELGKVYSTNGKVKLYNVRFYQMALSHREILNNYTASFSNIIEKEQKYNTNNVFNVSTGKVDLNKLENDYDLQIPYMKIVGGWPTQSKRKWTLQTDSTQKPGLPTGKKDFKLIDVYVRYPDNDYFKNYHKKDENYYSYIFKNEFASGHKMSEAFGETPSNGGCIMYAQGTSSLEYPVKNLRIRFKKKENYFKVRPNLAPSEIICMKADYMDSSGSHNTGGGNFVDDVYADTNMITPGQTAFQTEDNRIVTCSKGHPCLIFYSENEEGPFEYIGKYNLNCFIKLFASSSEVCQKEYFFEDMFIVNSPFLFNFMFWSKTHFFCPFLLFL